MICSVCSVLISLLLSLQVCTKLKKVVERWDGWLVEFLNGERYQELRDIASGLLTVPLKVRVSRKVREK